MQLFGELLKICREEHGLTQKAFVERLSLFSPLFFGLNTVTLSRWETGTTFPGLKKRQALLRYICSHRYLEHKQCMKYIYQAYEKLQTPFNEILDHKFPNIIGHFAPFKIDPDRYNFTHVSDYSYEKLCYLIDLERSNHPDNYYDLDIDMLQRWCEYESTLCLGCEIDGEHVGHFLLLKISSETAESIITNRKSVFSLKREDFIPSKEVGIYLVHTFFAVNSEVMAMLCVKALLFLLEERDVIENIVSFLTRNEGVELMRMFGHRIVEEGYDASGNFQWHGTKSTIEEILFSDIVVQNLFK